MFECSRKKIGRLGISLCQKIWLQIYMLQILNISKSLHISPHAHRKQTHSPMKRWRCNKSKYCIRCTRYAVSRYNKYAYSVRVRYILLIMLMYYCTVISWCIVAGTYPLGVPSVWMIRPWTLRSPYVMPMRSIFTLLPCSISFVQLEKLTKMLLNLLKTAFMLLLPQIWGLVTHTYFDRMVRKIPSNHEKGEYRILYWQSHKIRSFFLLPIRISIPKQILRPIYKESVKIWRKGCDFNATRAVALSQFESHRIAQTSFQFHCIAADTIDTQWVKFS